MKTRLAPSTGTRLDGSFLPCTAIPSVFVSAADVMSCVSDVLWFRSLCAVMCVYSETFSSTAITIWMCIVRPFVLIPCCTLNAYVFQLIHVGSMACEWG